MNIMVFDIETIPDVEGGRRLHDFDGLDDQAVGNAMFKQRYEKVGNEFIAHHLQKIVAISVVFRHAETFRVWTLGEEDSTEKEVIQRFFDGIERYTPTLVTWNGSGFDLPVIHYRTLIHKISAPRYWEIGEDDSAFRFNNYLNRFQWRHTDLMDVLAGYQMRSSAKLDEMASLLGFPGKMGMSGGKVWDTYLEGDIKSIRDYCETDVLNTYLVYLRFELMRGRLTEKSYEQECELVRAELRNSGKQHLEGFNDAWK